MGKCQSKSLGLYRKRDGPEGECFVVNAHFNPLALSECEDMLKSHHRTSSEITLSLSSCPKEDAVFANRVGFAEDRYPLQVLLPPENCSTTKSTTTTDDLKKVEIRDSNLDDDDKKGDSGERCECDVGIETDVTNKDRREFVFTLYDLDGYGKITKDDIAGLVRGIYEAMGTSIELPPSGSKTIKVKLTVSPEKDDHDVITTANNDRVDSAKDCQSEKEAKRAADQERDEDEEKNAAAFETETALVVSSDTDEADDEHLLLLPVSNTAVTAVPPTPPHVTQPCSCSASSPLRRDRVMSTTVSSSPLRSPVQRVLPTSAHNNGSPRVSAAAAILTTSTAGYDVDDAAGTTTVTADLVGGGLGPMNKAGVSLSSSPGRWKNHHQRTSGGGNGGKAGLTSATGLARKQKLLEIIQANLEKNNFHYVESSRRRAGETNEATTTGDKQSQQQPQTAPNHTHHQQQQQPPRYHHNHHHPRNQHSSHHACKNRRSHYLDLAGMENYHLDFTSVSPPTYAAEEDGDAEEEEEEEDDDPCTYRVRPAAATCTVKATAPRHHRSCHHPTCYTAKQQRHQHCGHQRVTNGPGEHAAAPHHAFRYHLLAEDSGAASSINNPHHQCTDEPNAKSDPRRLSSVDKSADWLRGINGGNGVHPHLSDLRASAAYHVRSRSYDAYDCGEVVPRLAHVPFLSPQKTVKYRYSPHKTTPVLGGQQAAAVPTPITAEISSPHQHHKHRHRDRDHQRAMKQVASWLEREHHLGCSGSGVPLVVPNDPVPFPPNPYHPHSPHHHQSPTVTRQQQQQQQPPQHEQPTAAGSPRSPERAPLVAERHEHHHIHEHYHHHYHHYHEL